MYLSEISGGFAILIIIISHVLILILKSAFFGRDDILKHLYVKKT